MKDHKPNQSLTKDLTVDFERKSSQSGILPNKTLDNIVESEQKKEPRDEHYSLGKSKIEVNQDQQEVESALKGSQEIKTPNSQSRYQSQLEKQKKEEYSKQLMDEIKNMDKMVLHAKCAAIRDQQLIEKQRLAMERKQQEKRIDYENEQLRLKQVEYQNETEKNRKQGMRDSYQTIIDQIQKNKLARMKEKQLQRLEGEAIVESIKQQQLEEKEMEIVLFFLNYLTFKLPDLFVCEWNSKRKREQQKIMLDLIHKENEIAKQTRKKLVQQEREKDEMYLKYSVEKDQREAQFLEQKKKLRIEQEKEVSRLLIMQEKANDISGQLDELKMKRIMEQADQIQRTREEQEAKYREKVKLSLYESRQVQMKEKEIRQQEKEKQNLLEAQRIAEMIQKDNEQYAQLQQDLDSQKKQYLQYLRQQITENENQQKQSQYAKIEERKRKRDELIEYQRILEEVRVQKLNELQALNVPEKYTSELRRKKLEI